MRRIKKRTNPFFFVVHEYFFHGDKLFWVAVVACFKHFPVQTLSMRDYLKNVFSMIKGFIDYE